MASSPKGTRTIRKSSVTDALAGSGTLVIGAVVVSIAVEAGTVDLGADGI